MTINYDAKAASAKRMLSQFGSYGYVKIKRDDGVLNPVDGTNSGAITVHNLYAVDLSVSADLVGDGLVQASDRMVIMSSDVEPLLSDTITIGSVDHKAIRIIKTSPAGVDVLYKVVCRA